MSRYVHKIEISLVGIEHLSKENKEINYERRSQTRRELFFLVSWRVAHHWKDYNYRVSGTSRIHMKIISLFFTCLLVDEAQREVVSCLYEIAKIKNGFWNPCFLRTYLTAYPLWSSDEPNKIIGFVEWISEI